MQNAREKSGELNSISQKQAKCGAIQSYIMPKIPATQRAEEDHELKTNLENLKEIMSQIS